LLGLSVMRRQVTDRWAGRLGALAVGVGLAAACGGESNGPPPTTGGTGAVGGRAFPVGGSAGSSGGGGTSGEAGSGGTGGDMTPQGGEGGVIDEPDPMGPVVEVTSPPELETAADGDVLVGDEVEVVCEARPGEGGQAVDPTLVTIALLDADENVIDEVSASPGAEPDQYTATLILTQVPENGPVGFRCTAADRSSPPLVGSGELWSLVDHGPLIEVVSPAHDEVHALGSPVPFEFTVLRSPVSANDPEADVEAVTLEVFSVDIDPGAPDNDGRYTVAVDLEDPAVFPGVVSGPVSFTVRATNGRTPDAVQRVFSDNFIVDGTGPQITIEGPAEGEVVGSQITVAFTVVDALSDVDPASVVVSVNGIESRYDASSPNWTRTNDHYVCRFDSTEAGASAFQATVNVRAQDEVGNPSSGTSRQVYLDNYPPTVDLVPPNVREWRDNSGAMECSKSFDPLGPWAPNDLADVDRSIFPRVLVWEETNNIGQMYLHFSGTDEASVRLYLQRDPQVPVLIDSNGDTVCDEVPDIYKTNGPLIELRAIDPAGDPWWGTDAPALAPATTDFPYSPGECLLASESEPILLCTDESSDLTRVIKHEMTGSVPVIFGAGSNQGVECTGTDWEIGPQAPAEGWVCFAARAEDFAGNVGVSRPIRLCYDDSSTGAVPTCVTDKSNPPTCTDGCTMPPAFTAPLYLEH